MITLNDRGLTMSKTLKKYGPVQFTLVYYLSYGDVYKRILFWEASMKKQFLEFLDDIITTVIENCSVEVEAYIDDDGKRKAVETIVRQDGIEERLLAVIKRHLDKVED